MKKLMEIVALLISPCPMEFSARTVADLAFFMR